MPQTDTIPGPRLDTTPGPRPDTTTLPAQNPFSILAAREARWMRKLALARSLTGEGRGTQAAILTLTLRMPATMRASYRMSRLALGLHRELLERLRDRGWVIGHAVFLLSADDPESTLVVEAPAQDLKAFALDLEATHPLGSLLDLDVMDAQGHPLSRQDQNLAPRSCLVCGNPAALCTAGRLHPLESVERAINDILARASWPDDPGPESPDTRTETTIARAALSALLYEVALSPKPGLVCPDSTGSHHDMDYGTFLASAEALAPFFPRLAAAGINHRGRPHDLLPTLRSIGLEAESAMFAATGGVNTHKGLIFSLGLLCAAQGILCSTHNLQGAGSGTLEVGSSGPTGTTCPSASPTEVSRGPAAICRMACDLAAAIAQGIGGELDQPGHAGPPLSGAESASRLTSGQRLYRERGVRGIRGEVEAGFPSVLFHALPRLQASLASGLSLEEAAIDALLALFLVVEDTNLLSRAGDQGLQTLREGATQALALGGIATKPGRAAIEALDRHLIDLHASPGGSADLLAVTLFLAILAHTP